MSPPGGEPRRLVELDVLRGFALSGILLVNALLTAGPDVVHGGGPGAPAVDRVAAWVVTALVTTKFYLLFSFLFGCSFVFQERSARRAGAAFAPRHLRRTAALFALGVLHAVLLFPGDILTTYAVLGLVLYGLRGLRPRAALRLAAVLLAAVAAVLLAYGLLTAALTAAAAPVPDTPDTAAYRGGAASVVAAHLGDLPAALAANLLYAPDMMAAFLAGLAAARSGLVERRGRDRAWLRGAVHRLLPVGLAGGVVAACCANGPLDGRWFLAGRAVAVLTAPALTAAYACGLLLLLDLRGPAARVLASAGRMALSHYLAQSLVLACVFTGYGLALYGRPGTAAVLAGCVPLYGAQLALGALWAGRARYGPAELLLRTLTLGRRPGRDGSTSPGPRRARPAAGPRPAP